MFVFALRSFIRFIDFFLFIKQVSIHHFSLHFASFFKKMPYPKNSYATQKL